MVDTDDTRRTTDDGRRTTPRVWHKLPTGELIIDWLEKQFNSLNTTFYLTQFNMKIKFCITIKEQVNNSN